MNRPYVLAETTFQETRALQYQVAVLPWGATEAHNFHLPYSTDNYQATAIAEEAARLAWEQGTRAIVLPGIPFGANAQQMDIPLTIDLSPSTQFIVLQDVVASLEVHGVSRLVILNGHGGNDFKWMVRELQEETSVFLTVVNWYTFLDISKFFDEPGDHAGEMETSLMLHLEGHLVKPLSEAGSGEEKKSVINALREGRAWAPRQWTQVTQDTGIGNPAKATKEKGEIFFARLTEALAIFFIELANVEMEGLYE